MKIHILGASGSGVTTTGRMLAEQRQLLFLDADDFFWADTELPYTRTNPTETRWRLLDDRIGNAENWLIAGSMHSWCEPYMHLFDLVVFLDVTTEVRLTRLRKRESQVFGDRILPGGDMCKNHRDFIEWAAQYDQGRLPGRSRARHEKFLKQLNCPILRIEGVMPVHATVDLINRELQTL